MSQSILERIEAHQLHIIDGQAVIIATMGTLRAEVDEHDDRIGRLEKRVRWLWWMMPVACAVSAVAGAWFAVRF